MGFLESVVNPGSLLGGDGKDKSGPSPEAPEVTKQSAVTDTSVEDNKLKRSRGKSDQVLLQGQSSSGRKRLLGQ